MSVNTTNVQLILKTLRDRYPDVKTQLEHQTPFQLLIATIMSAQCTDRQVNQVTRNLFEVYPDAETLSRAPVHHLKKLIFSTRFYNNKARNIKACARMLAQEHQGKVPEDLEILIKLPGVGRKTANVVLSVAYGHQTIVTDTHVLRVTRRLGLTRNTDPVKVEFDLMKMIPESLWNDFSLQLIYFGRDICDAKKPLCHDCPLYALCPSKGEKL